MEIYSIDYSDYKMFNPITGEVIVEEECNDDAKSLKGYWMGGFLNEPIINDKALKTAWEAFVENFNKDNHGTPFCWNALDKFLRVFDNPSWKAYEITSSGIACGPIGYTVVYVVDEDVIVEELGEEEMDVENGDDQE
jgi:hypothetical protein